MLCFLYAGSLALSCMEGFHFYWRSACLWLSTLTSLFPFWIFFRFFGVALVDNTFSIRKGVNLARQTTSKDSMTMNLGKSAASPSKSDSDWFRLFFNRWCMFSLTLYSTCRHGVQFVLGVIQGENPFTLVVTGIHDQYTRAESRSLSGCTFQVISTSQIPILSTQLTLSQLLLATKRKGSGTCIKWGFKSMARIKHIGAWGWHDQPIDRIGPIRPPLSVLQFIDHSVAGSMTAQPPGSRPSVLQEAIVAGVQSAYFTAPTNRVKRSRSLFPKRVALLQGMGLSCYII